MLSRVTSYMNVFGLLLKTDLVILLKIIVGKIVNILFWSVSIVVVATYIFPKLGMTETFGQFMVVSSIVAHSYWGIWNSTYMFINDLESNNEISYKLILPMPSWMVILQYAIKHSVVKFLPSLIVLPFFKIILGNRMDLSHFSFFKFTFIFVTICLFTGFFFICIAGFVKATNNVENVGIRLLFPLWFFGATQYSWSIMHSINPTIGYFTLLNPLVYAMEGIHSAVLGPSGYLSFWACAGVLWGFILVFGFVGMVRLKKRLDFV